MQGNDGSGQRVGRIHMVSISRIRGTKKEEGAIQQKRAFLEFIGIIISATVFAISYSGLLGSVMPIITLFSGLIFR